MKREQRNKEMRRRLSGNNVINLKELGSTHINTDQTPRSTLCLMVEGLIWLH